MRINFTKNLMWAVISILMICHTHTLQAQDTGCTNPDACNFDAEATQDDASCLFPADACDDEDPFTENDIYQTDCACAGVYNPGLESECYGTNAGVVISTDTIGAFDVIAVDMDGDGDNDILASTNKEQILWYENDGQGNFSSEIIIDEGNLSLSSIFASDLDGDGDQDILATSFNGNKVIWYENDGQGNFSSEIIIAADVEQALNVYAIDLDGDGDNDVLSSSRGSENKFAWYENDGQGNFGSQNIIAFSTGIASGVHAADLDGDGDNDVMTTSIFEGEVFWYENDGQGGFGTTGNLIVADPINPILRIDAADFDGDGDNDVLVTNAATNRVLWYKNDGQGNFDTGNLITMNQGIPFGICIVDIDSDGDSDILGAFLISNAKVSLYENDGQGNFTESIISSNLGGPWIACATDFDGDGDNDIVAADGSDPFDFFDNGGIVWYENDCDTVVEETIPTLSDWGLIILGLILLNLGVLYIRQTEMRELVIR